MAAAQPHKVTFFGWFGSKKPTKPDSRANRAAFKLGAAQSKKGSTTALQQVVLMSLQNDARLRK